MTDWYNDLSILVELVVQQHVFCGEGVKINPKFGPSRQKVDCPSDSDKISI